MMHTHWNLKIVFLGLPIIGSLVFFIGVFIIGCRKGSLDGIDVTLSYSTRQIQVEQIVMDSETFLVFMMAQEISPDAEIAVLRAQAIVSRSKLWYEMKQQTLKQEAKGTVINTEYVWQAKDMDVSWNNILNMQKQWGDNFGSCYQRLQEAVQDTACEVLSCNDAVIEGRWHSVSAGNTRSYTCNGVTLFGVEGYDDLEAGAISICYWSRDLAIAHLQQVYPELDVKKGKKLADQIQITKRDASDYVTEVTAGNKVYTGEEVADLLSLPSCCFYLANWQEGVRIVVKGQGSGYGISQKGAERMAEAGADENEILEYYYPNAEVKQGIF